MTNFHALIPAAGSGLRAGDAMPKQYRPLNGKPMLWHAMQPFFQHPRIRHIYVVLSPGDEVFTGFDWSGFGSRLRVLHCGGESRARSVLSGLAAMAKDCAAEDEVLVHDAARPCVTVEDIERLIVAVGGSEAGGLLGEPLSDTLKRADTRGCVVRTEPRDHLWRAQTPQMFRHGVLLQALSASESLEGITDDASAVERLGLRPLMVRSGAANLKVTYPEDFPLAELILKGRSEQA